MVQHVMKNLKAAALTLALVPAVLAGCGDDGPPITVVPQPPALECDVDEAAQRFEVYFVVDVSGSMTPFLTELNLALREFASSFPDRDAQDRRILVDYYVVGFVNDVAWLPSQFGRRLSSAISVQSAISSGIEAASNNRLLTSNGVNAEAEENALDALNFVLTNSVPDDNTRVLVLFATDANFGNIGSMLAGENDDDIVVQADYATLRQEYLDREIRLHAFVPGELDGITRNYAGMPELTTGPGSATYNLRELSESQDLIRDTLNEIAEDAACKAPGARQGTQ